jgi:uncharacterized cupin superfamily protein
VTDRILLLASAQMDISQLPRNASIGTEDPLGARRNVAWSGSDGLFVGSASVGGVIEIPSWPHTEMFVVSKGEVRIENSGNIQTLLPGQGGVIGFGSRAVIEAEADSVWTFFVSVPASVPAEHNAGPVLLDARAALSPSSPPPASALIGPAPSCRRFEAFADVATTQSVGVWEATPYAREVRPHKVHELMHILSGSVELSEPDGRIVTVRKGETVFVPKGAQCGWNSQELVRKFFAVQD